jgi:hypothetical protein
MKHASRIAQALFRERQKAWAAAERDDRRLSADYEIALHNVAAELDGVYPGVLAEYEAALAVL